MKKYRFDTVPVDQSTPSILESMWDKPNSDNFCLLYVGSWDGAIDSKTSWMNTRTDQSRTFLQKPSTRVSFVRDHAKDVLCSIKGNILYKEIFGQQIRKEPRKGLGPFRIVINFQKKTRETHKKLSLFFIFNELDSNKLTLNSLAKDFLRWAVETFAKLSFNQFSASGATVKKTGYHNETAKITAESQFSLFCSVLVPNTKTNIEFLNGRRILTLGLPTVNIVNRIHFRLILYFDLFDSCCFPLGSQKLQLTLTYLLLLYVPCWWRNKHFDVQLRWSTTVQFLPKDGEDMVFEGEGGNGGWIILFPAESALSLRSKS